MIQFKKNADLLRSIQALQLVPGSAGEARYLAPKVAIVVPAFNEERNIEKVLLEIQSLQRARPRWEVLAVVVNDGSTDRTEQVLEEISPKFHVRVIHLPLNVGIGKAVQTGFRFATGWGADVTIQLDGDGQHPADLIPQIVGPVLAEKADVVVGSRYIAGAGGNVSSPLRQAGTWLFSWLLRVIAGVKVTDTTSGFRAFGKDAADLIARYYPDDYPEVQAYVPLARRGFKILEVPVAMRPRAGGRSSITPIRSLYYVLKVAFATVLDTLRPMPVRQRSPRRREKGRAQRGG